MVLSSALALATACIACKRNEPIPEGTMHPLAANARPAETADVDRADAAVGSATSVTVLTSGALAPPARPAPKRDDVAVPPPEPRSGGGTYSIIEAPRLRQNLGLVGPDGGAVPPPAPIARPIPRVIHPAVEDDVPGQTSHEGPASAADPTPWAGDTHWPSR